MKSLYLLNEARYRKHPQQTLHPVKVWNKRYISKEVAIANVVGLTRQLLPYEKKDFQRL